RADAYSFRVGAFVDGPARAAEFVALVDRALATEIAPGTPELDLVARRLASLRRHPLDGAALAPVFGCTGQLGLVASEPAVDPKQPSGAQKVEAWRKLSAVRARMAFGVAGATSITDAMASAVRRIDDLPRGDPFEAPWPDEDASGVYAAADRQP